MDCSAQTLRDERCRNQVYYDSGMQFCWVHLAMDMIDHLMHNRSTPRPLRKTQQCVVQNRNGTKCWHWTTRREDGLPVCYSHRKRERVITPVQLITGSVS